MKLIFCAVVLLTFFRSFNIVALENSNKNVAIDFDELPLEQSIKILKGNGAKKIAVFYEIDCTYCKLLEKYEFSRVSDVTVYNFLFVNGTKDSSSWKKAEAIWCASDNKKAWSDFILKDHIDTNVRLCKTPIEENKALAVKLGVKGTPTIFFSNGTKSVGVIKAKQIEQRILDADFYNN